MKRAASVLRVEREGLVFELELRPEREDGEPRVRDLDLGTWFELQRPLDVRAIVRRNLGKLLPVVAEDTGWKRAVFWLTEDEALFTAARIRSPRVPEHTRRLVEVFAAARAQTEERALAIVEPEPRAFTFEGRALQVRAWQGRPCVVAHELGALLGYADGSRLVDKIRGEWAEEFLDGTDSALLTNGDLAEWKRLSPEPGESLPREGGSRSLVILFEAGMYLATIKARTPVGTRVRRWLASEVLPTLARTGAYSRPGRELQAPAGVDLAALAREAVRAVLAERSL